MSGRFVAPMINTAMKKYCYRCLRDINLKSPKMETRRFKGSKKMLITPSNMCANLDHSSRKLPRGSSVSLHSKNCVAFSTAFSADYSL